MEQMVEPDRTILIVSIIGLVIIWGSVLYHKLVQGGGGPDSQGRPAIADQTESLAAGSGEPGADAGSEGGGEDRRSRKRGKKRR